MKPNGIDRTNWAFWVRAGWWSHDEATLILLKQVPDATHEQFTNIDGIVESVSCIEMFGGESLREIIKRNFQGDRVPVAEFFSWAQSNGLPLPDSLLEEAEKIEALNVRRASFKSTAKQIDGRGAHHAQTRYRIVCAALRYINSLNEDEAKEIIKGTKGLNISRISEVIDDQRYKFLDTENQIPGTSQKNIANTLYAALKPYSPKSTE